MTWFVSIPDYASGSRITLERPLPRASISEGYLKRAQDSFYIQNSTVAEADLMLFNIKGDHLAALKFTQTPAYVWIRNDLKRSYQHAIATLFAVILGIRDL